jgi:hypothetical protein
MRRPILYGLAITLLLVGGVALVRVRARRDLRCPCPASQCAGGPTSPCVACCEPFCLWYPAKGSHDGCAAHR